MGLHIATGLDRLVRRTETNALRAGRLNIGTRLMLGFGLIILSMMVVDAVVLWQFNAVRTRAGRLREIDQKRLAILRVHASLLAFNDRLNTLADSEDATRLRVEAGSLRSTVLDDIRGATSTFGPQPLAPQRDPSVGTTLHVIERTLPSQLEAITALAASGDWRAVHARLANQSRSLATLSSMLVERVDDEVGEEQAQTVLALERAQRRVFLIVPTTAVLTLLIGVGLSRCPRRRRPGRVRDASHAQIRDSAVRPILLDLARLEERLEALLGRRVDVVTEAGLQEPIRSTALREAFRV